MECPICHEEAGGTPAALIAHTEANHILSDAQTQFGGRCEDFPCCGHENGDCPVFSTESGYLPYPCLGCGDRIPSSGPKCSNSSYCNKCKRNPATFCEGRDCPGCSACMNEPDEDEDEEIDHESMEDDFDPRYNGSEQD